MEALLQRDGRTTMASDPTSDDESKDPDEGPTPDDLRGPGAEG
jgi:hypothetical protein